MQPQNEYLIKNFKTKEAEKLEVLTFSLGQVKDLKELAGVIKRDDEGVKIITKESPAGQLYDGEATAVARIIGEQAKIDGKYDIYIHCGLSKWRLSLKRPL